jgi:uncharacterized membrane protein
MSVFCLLWIPVFYLFWSSFGHARMDVSSALAIILGTAAAFVQFFTGDFIETGGIGFSSWLNVFVDITSAPVLLPLLVYALFLLLRIGKDLGGFGGFALIWLIPEGIMRTVQWGVEKNPAKLVLTPLLWTATAVCVSFYITLLRGTVKELKKLEKIEKNKIMKKRALIVLSFFGILTISPLSASAYWAYYAQYRLLFPILLTLALAQFIAAVVFLWRRSSETPEENI